MIKQFKKFTYTLAVALAALVAIPATVSAAPNYIEGGVTINGMSAGGAKVIVTCNGYAKTATASSNGFYSVKFKEDRCPTGSSFNVTAKKGNKGGVAQGTVSGQTTVANVNVSTVAVPEYGPIAAIASVGLAGAGFMFMRRRQQMQTNSGPAAIA